MYKGKGLAAHPANSPGASATTRAPPRAHSYVKHIPPLPCLQALHSAMPDCTAGQLHAIRLHKTLPH